MVRSPHFMCASTVHSAQSTSKIGGDRTIRIDPDRGTVSIRGLRQHWEHWRRTKRSRSDQDSDRPRKQAPQEAKTEPQAPEATPAAP